MINVSHLDYDYETERGPVAVFRDLNLTIDEGSFVAVLGHNGSGKSTLAKHLNAIALPAGGTVYVDGINTADEAMLFELRRRVGMVFQNPDNQIVATLVEEDVAFGPENLAVPPDEIRRRVDDALKTVRMTAFAKHAPHLLSGGQKQRVAIAGILAMEPRCIVLDEPTAMLDPVGREEVMETIRRLNRENGMTIVLITHYMDEAVKADRVIVMNHGRIVMDDVPRVIFPQVEALKEAKLDVPQVTELMYELHRRGAMVRTDILRSDECVEELARLLGKGCGV